MSGTSSCFLHILASCDERYFEITLSIFSLCSTIISDPSNLMTLSHHHADPRAVVEQYLGSLSLWSLMTATGSPVLTAAMPSSAELEVFWYGYLRGDGLWVPPGEEWKDDALYPLRAEVRERVVQYGTPHGAPSEVLDKLQSP
jgi:hypothetical protein